MTRTSVPAALLPTLTVGQLADIYAACTIAGRSLRAGSVARARMSMRASRAERVAFARGFAVAVSFDGVSGVYEQIVTVHTAETRAAAEATWSARRADFYGRLAA